MTHTQFLIVGQGISGTFLSFYLNKKGVDYLVIDDNNASSSSRVAAGVINPVTGRRIVRTWMIETLLPFARQAYAELQYDTGKIFFSEKSIVNLFPSAQMRNAFIERLQEEEAFLKLSGDDHRFSAYLEYVFGDGEIFPAFVVQLQELLTGWRNRLMEKNRLIEEHFEGNNLLLEKDGVHYGNIRAEKIIFCDGIVSSENRYFRNLPFAANKGEALVIRVPELPQQYVFKKAITLVPLGDEYFWAGASHEWDFTDTLPSEVFLEKTKRQLNNWLKVPFTVERHVSSVRPATLERRPFVGLHPHEPRMGILNGMGTKGCSLAPFFANQLAEHLTSNEPLMPEVNINRFTRILQAGI